MADTMDLVQQHTEEMLARNIAAVTRRLVQVSAFFCDDCDAEIPAARRQAITGVNAGTGGRTQQADVRYCG